MKLVTKYIGFFVLEFRQMSEFKSDFYLFWIESLFKALIMTTFWWKLWGHSDSNFSFIDQQTFMALLLSTQILQLPFRGTETIAQMMEAPIISGKMALVLCRPVHPIWMNLARVICQQGRLMVLSVILWVLSDKFLLPELGYQSQMVLENMPMILLSLLLGCLVNFFLFTAIGIFSFWVGEVWSLMYVIGIFAGFLSGQFFPLHINESLEFWSSFFPFRYISYSVAMIGCHLGGWAEIGRQSLCLMILALMTFYGYAKGLRKFEASGG